MSLLSATLSIALAFLMAMDDPAAMAQARKLWGPLGRIGQARNSSDTYWVKQVGVDTTCGNPSDRAAQSFTVLGSAPNTWEAAFAAVPVNPIWGPYAGPMTLDAEASGSDVIEIQFRIDNVALPVEVRATPLRQWIVSSDPVPNGVSLVPVAVTAWSVSQMWNSASLPDGVHFLCVTTRDSTGKLTRSLPLVFRTDQGEPTAGHSLRVPAR